MQEHTKIIAVRDNDVAHEMAGYFRPFGITEIDYSVHRKADRQDLKEVLTPGTLQLVFTSHTESLNSIHVARMIKEMNPHAIVFALTGLPTSANVADKFRDGIVNSRNLVLPGALAAAFLRGVGLQQLRELISREATAEADRSRFVQAIALATT